MADDGATHRDPGEHASDGADRGIARRADPEACRRRQRSAQVEMVRALHTALDARRLRIVVSQSAVGRVKWAGILLQGLCTPDPPGWLEPLSA